jgi:8-hydroxy-5-deazaflavin:NADPH oxidoreductase
MRIAVIGSGNIGGTLGAAWARTGHEVQFGSRSPEPPDRVAIADAIEAADVVLLAIPGNAVAELAESHGAALHEKLVIDATNRIGEATMSGAEHLLPRTPRYVRAFNSVGWEIMAEPGEATMFWSGPEADTELVEQLIADVGLRPIRVGDVDASDVVDGVGRLWLTLVFRAGYPRQIAFKLLGV